LRLLAPRYLSEYTFFRDDCGLSLGTFPDREDVELDFRRGPLRSEKFLETVGLPIKYPLPTGLRAFFSRRYVKPLVNTTDVLRAHTPPLQEKCPPPVPSEPLF